MIRGDADAGLPREPREIPRARASWSARRRRAWPPRPWCSARGRGSRVGSADDTAVPGTVRFGEAEKGRGGRRAESGGWRRRACRASISSPSRSPRGASRAIWRRRRSVSRRASASRDSVASASRVEASRAASARASSSSRRSRRATRIARWSSAAPTSSRSSRRKRSMRSSSSVAHAASEGSAEGSCAWSSSPPGSSGASRTSGTRRAPPASLASSMCISPRRE